MQKDAWSKFSLDSLVTNRDKKFCDADTLTEEMKELLIEKTLEAIDKVYAILEAVEPCGEDNRRELWLKAERGTIDDYDDYESLKDEEVVENCNLLEYLTQRDIQTKNSGVNVRYRGKHRFFKGFNEFIKEKTRRCDNDFEKIERHVFF